MHVCAQLVFPSPASVRALPGVTRFAASDSLKRDNHCSWALVITLCAHYLPTIWFPELSLFSGAVHKAGSVERCSHNRHDEIAAWINSVVGSYREAARADLRSTSRSSQPNRDATGPPETLRQPWLRL